MKKRNEQMNIRIIYTCRIPLFRVRQKTKHYLHKSEYIHRNGVFTHTRAIITYSVQKNVVDILCEQTDESSVRQVSQYIQFVFGTNPIGLRVSDSKQYLAFSALNYVRI